ncbi:MAG: glycine--tRNA ligase subunit beta [Desulforhopalus sp.]|nr:glycine--tRNA ligase subunit beta [Desulforhopalus sp.]
MRDLLFEIGMEEIPASYLEPALTQLKNRFAEKASDLKIGYGEIKTLGTPRRLALIVKNINEKQEDITEELLGPSKSAGFDANGKTTRAADGFAKSKGANVSDLQVVTTPKGEYLMLLRKQKGVETANLLPDLLQSLILDVSFPKSMKWGSNTHAFARPIQWLVAIFGEEVIRFSHAGVESSNSSGGHRFLANKRFTINSVATYEQQLADHFVLLDQTKRRARVVSEIEQAVAQSAELQGGRVAIDEVLVDTVTNLVEMPFGVCGTFDEKYLQLPADVLITSMREHQKYFPVVNQTGKLLPGFVAVNNTKVKDTAITRKGHQRVLRARLEDALFFFNSDRETKLEDRIANLQGIIFQAKLGTMLEKKDRLVKLVRILADKVVPELADDGCRAALLCKADLLSNMVGEFPSLQGTMGGAYAIHDGEKDNVAAAIVEHYMPKRAGAELPSSELGSILALADRFDTLAGCFGIGQVPSGTADPFGLRRISIAILHIIQGKKYSLSLRELIHKALALYGNKVAGGNDTVETVVAFIKGRFANDCISRGIAADAVDAAVSVNFDDVNDCLLRVNAILQLRKDPALKVLAASYKRVKNIIKDNRETVVDVSLFEHQTERNLYELFLTVREEMARHITVKEYAKALEVMLRMKEPVDAFFDDVMVMAEDLSVRKNRLSLLTLLGEQILLIGDISLLQEA